MDNSRRPQVDARMRAAAWISAPFTTTGLLGLARMLLLLLLLQRALSSFAATTTITIPIEPR